MNLGKYLGVDISQARHMSAVVFSLQNTTAIATLTLLPILIAVGLWSSVASSIGRVIGAEPKSQFLTSDKCFSTILAIAGLPRSKSLRAPTKSTRPAVGLDVFFEVSFLSLLGWRLLLLKG